MIMKRTLFSLLLIGFVFNSNAASVFAALVPDTPDTFILVTLVDKACDPKNGNSSLVSASSSLKGCWMQDGPTYKVTLFETNEVKIFPKTEFKFMGDSVTKVTTKPQENKLSTVLTCVADAWAGDVTVERNEDGSLKSVHVSGEKVSSSEKANAINFSFSGMNISLSTLTGVFNYETSGFQKYLNNRLLGGGSAKGAGICKVNNAIKQF
jgi:hypothetical protein